ncbi:MAG: hypothetical protein ACE5I1_06130 [bacterium]
MARFEVRRRLISGGFGVVFLSVGLLISGCGEIPVNAPQAFEKEDIQTSDVVYVPRLLKTNPVKPVKKKNSKGKCDGTTKSKKIKAEKGGKLKHCDHKIKVPANALSQDTKISINVMSTAFMDIDFGPDGTFSKPVEITISYKDADLSGINEDNLTIAWFDPGSNTYYDVGGTINKKKKYIKVLVNHFTQYSLSVR